MTLLQIAEFLKGLGVGRRFYDPELGFGSYEGAGKLVDEIKRASDEIPLPNIFLFGSTGSGKTHLAISILKRHLESGRAVRRKIVYSPAIEFYAMLKEAMDSKLLDYDLIIGNAIEADLLVFDDLGGEKVSEWSIEVLNRIADKRYCEMRPTIVTSNLAPVEVEKRYGARIASRLCTGHVFQIKLPDFRKKQAMARKSVEE